MIQRDRNYWAGVVIGLLLAAGIAMMAWLIRSSTAGGRESDAQPRVHTHFAYDQRSNRPPIIITCTGKYLSIRMLPDRGRHLK